MVDCFRKIVQTEGVRGLYCGLTPPLVGGAAETGVNYLVYSRVLSALRDREGGLPHLTAVPVAAAAGGVALSAILGPTELIKCRLQVKSRFQLVTKIK